MDAKWLLRSLQSNEVETALAYAKSTQLFSDLQIMWIREHITGFSRGELVDDYQVLTCWSSSHLGGFLVFRKRPLTQSTFEIGQVVISQKDARENTTRLIESLTEIVKLSGGDSIFIELADSVKWAEIRSVLIEHGFSTVGRIPHLYQPGLGALYLIKRL